MIYTPDMAPNLLRLANKNDPLCVTLPKVAKASKVVNITLQYHGHYYVQTSPV